MIYQPTRRSSSTTSGRHHPAKTSSFFYAWLGLFLIAASLLSNAPPALAQTIARGPYLQLGTSSSIVVRWRTSVATDSRVQFGSTPAALTTMVSSPTLTTEHVVTLTGLSADTSYYYSVGSTTQVLAGADTSHFFVTAPTPGVAQPTRIWVIGDAGTADANAAAVRDAYVNFTGTRHTDLWLMLGDNAYQSGTDAEYQTAVFNMYPTLLRQSVVWPTLGNHDGVAADSATQSGPYYDIFTLPKNGEAGGLASGTEAYYSFDFGNIHFTVLDSFETSRAPNGAMLTWLANDLAATTQPWIIAFWHHPPYSKGSHDSDTDIELIEMRQNALPILEAAGVDLVLTGHSHSYERSYLLDGHYGSSSTLTPSMIRDGGSGRVDGTGAYGKSALDSVPHEGAVYAVAGSSGQTSAAPLNHPVMFISLLKLGSMVLDIDGNRLDARFIDNTGATGDYFTIVKGVTPKPSVTINATTPTATEAGPTNGMFTVARSGATAAALMVNYTVSGTATSGSDYAALSGTVTIPVGAASATITVAPVNDTLVEANETVIATLSASAAYTVGSPSSATVTIVSDDVNANLPTVTISAPIPTATEAGRRNGKFRVQRTGATSSTLTVRYTVGGTATPGSDYNSLSGAVTIPAGATRADILVAPIDDNLVEPTETVIVTLSPNAAYLVGTANKATVSITSND